MRAREFVNEGLLGNVLSWPQLVEKINNSMKAIGWRTLRQDENVFNYTMPGRNKDEWYTVLIENEGNGWFGYVLGTVEDGDPYIGEQDQLPMSDASVSELLSAVREGFNLSEATHLEETAGEANTNPVQWIIRDAWESVYPTVALHTGDAGYGLNPVFASTKKKYVKDQEYLSGMRDRQGHFYLQLSAGYDGPEMVINILDANAGRFPGAVTKILNELFQYLEKEYGQGQQTFRTLTVGDDASGGAWDHIATKLNANADLHRGYNVKQNAKQGVEEMAGEIHGGVRKALMAKGYKYLGSGIDKQAYVEPGTGQVLIVFGYRKGMKDFSPDQRMFIDWINYCNKNANNPHLPKFSGFESFQFGGQNYIQARMEPLRELPDEVGDLVGQLDQVTKKKYRDYRKPLQTAAQYATFQSAEMGNNTWYELEDVIEYLGGEQAAEALLQTVYQVQKFARQHRFSIDLHRGNYMQRPDGTIVVNDPFVLWLSSSGQRRSWGE